MSASAASAAEVPDPLAAGPYSTTKIDYEAGNLVVTLGDGVGTTKIPLRGSITYAPDVDFARVIAFVHGRHGVCIGSPSPGETVCDDLTDADGTPTQTDVRSYAGYDYMAKNLASHGYTVISLEANTSNFDNAYKDGGANARSQIIQANLELLWRWNNGAGPYVPGEPDHTVGTKLVGKLNFADGIGLMGHSRGGDAVTDFIGYTRNITPRAGFQRFTLDGVLALAPVNYTQYKMPYGTNFAVLLPACDGDVSTLQGARFFENAKYPSITTPTVADTFAKVQWYVQGANHNFFNTVWTQDDSSTATDPACSRAQTATTARLSPADQRRVGAALMNSFMRRYVGKETAFDPIMTGKVTLPESAAPLTSGKGLAEEVKTSYVAPAAQRLDVLRPNSIPDPQPDPATGALPTPFDATLTTTTASGGPITASGLSAFGVCNPNDLAWRQGPDIPDGLPAVPGGRDQPLQGQPVHGRLGRPGRLPARLSGTRRGARRRLTLRRPRPARGDEPRRPAQPGRRRLHAEARDAELRRHADRCHGQAGEHPRGQLVDRAGVVDRQPVQARRAQRHSHPADRVRRRGPDEGHRRRARVQHAGARLDPTRRRDVPGDAAGRRSGRSRGLRRRRRPGDRAEAGRAAVGRAGPDRRRPANGSHAVGGTGDRPREGLRRHVQAGHEGPAAHGGAGPAPGLGPRVRHRLRGGRRSARSWRSSSPRARARPAS